MADQLTHPRPGERLADAIIVASVDLDYEGQYIVVLLNPQPPYYTVAIICPDGDQFTVLESKTFDNINGAVHGFAEQGGDW